jgi:hypothetical protein
MDAVGVRLNIVQVQQRGRDEADAYAEADAGLCAVPTLPDFHLDKEILDFLDFHTSKILESFKTHETLLLNLQDNNHWKDNYEKMDDNEKIEASTLLKQLYYPNVAPIYFQEITDRLFEERSTSQIIEEVWENGLFKKHRALLTSYKICFENSVKSLRDAIRARFAWRKVRQPGGEIALVRPVRYDINKEINPWNHQNDFKNLSNRERFSESDIQADKPFGDFILQFMQCVMTQDRLTTELKKASGIGLLDNRFSDIKMHQMLINDINQRLYQIFRSINPFFNESGALASFQNADQLQTFFEREKLLHGTIFDYVKNEKDREPVLYFGPAMSNYFHLTTKDV